MQSKSKKWLVFWLCLILAFAGVFLVNAALLDLDAFVTFTIFDSGGLSPLPTGSLVYIVGSSNNISDPMLGVGPNNTQLIANSTTGDDVLLGSTVIGANNSSAGTFTITVKYDPSEIQYAYIRFFEWTNPAPVTGLVFWGTSAIFELVPTLGVARVDFNPNQDLSAVNQNFFVVIPEPGTANLMILFFAVLGGIRARMKRQQRSATPVENS